MTKIGRTIHYSKSAKIREIRSLISVKKTRSQAIEILKKKTATRKYGKKLKNGFCQTCHRTYYSIHIARKKV